MDDLIIAVNPDPESRLPYLLRLPLDAGMVFRVSGTWPRTKAIYCHPVSLDQWPAEPEIIERLAVRACARRGAAIDLVLERGRENRSQLVFTRARGRDVVFWQSARTRKQSRPNVRTPSARAAGIAMLEIVIDTRERYPYRFVAQQAVTVRRALRCGDYGVTADGRLLAAVERKSLPDLVSSLINGTLRYALGELAALPRAAVVVEDRYSQVFKLDRVRPAMIADGLAELQVRWPGVPISFCGSRQLAEEWTYRYLAAARAWAAADQALVGRISVDPDVVEVPAGVATSPEPTTTVIPVAVEAPGDPPTTEVSVAVDASGEPTTAQLRAWARSVGFAVPDRGRLRDELRQAWHDAHLSG